MKFACGTDITDGAECTGHDLFGIAASGVAVKGIKGQPEFVFKNHAHGQVHSGLDIQKFKAVKSEASTSN